MGEKKPVLLKTETLVDNKYLSYYAMDFDNGSKYLEASRRKKENLMVNMTDKERKTAYPDAVTCIVIVKMPRKTPKLLLQYEFRYPAGAFLLSPPAGLIDETDKIGTDREDGILLAAAREIKEETGILMGAKDEIYVVNPLLFTTPGMTDESNALVCCVIELPDESLLNPGGAEGTEVITDFKLLSKQEAKKILKEGTDPKGMPYSVQTWAALLYFVSDLWE